MYALLAGVMGENNWQIVVDQKSSKLRAESQ